MQVKIAKSLKRIKSHNEALNIVGKNKSKIYFLLHAGMENEFSVIAVGT